MKIVKVGAINNWQYNQKVRRFGEEIYKETRYQRNGLDLTVMARFKNGKKVGAAKQLKDYLGNILNGKAEQYSDGKKTKTVYIV